jgi:5'-deoxynucleotidase YfbR-like HD superfamily hydrolase
MDIASYGKEAGDMNLAKLYLLRRAARVERMHTRPLARQQTVGEHSFSVLALIDCVYPEATINLWRAALYHDAAEVITGDVPATAKWRYPIALGSNLDDIEKDIALTHGTDIVLSDKEQAVLKFCDTMELAIFAIEEAERGDRNAIRVAHNCMSFIAQQDPINSTASYLQEHIAGYLRRNFPDRGVLFNDRGE